MKLNKGNIFEAIENIDKKSIDEWGDKYREPPEQDSIAVMPVSFVGAIEAVERWRAEANKRIEERRKIALDSVDAHIEDRFKHMTKEEAKFNRAEKFTLDESLSPMVISEAIKTDTSVIYEVAKDGSPEIGKKFIAYSKRHKEYEIFERVDDKDWEDKKDADEHRSSDGHFYAGSHGWIYPIEFDRYIYVGDTNLKESMEMGNKKFITESDKFLSKLANESFDDWKTLAILLVDFIPEEELKRFDDKYFISEAINEADEEEIENVDVSVDDNDEEETVDVTEIEDTDNNEYYNSVINFKPWGGAIPTFLAIQEADKLDEFYYLLIDLYPTSIDSQTLNTLLWQDKEFIFDVLEIHPENTETMEESLNEN